MQCCFGDGLGLGGKAVEDAVHKGCHMVFHGGHCMVGGERECWEPMGGGLQVRQWEGVDL